MSASKVSAFCGIPMATMGEVRLVPRPSQIDLLAANLVPGMLLALVRPVIIIPIEPAPSPKKQQPFSSESVVEKSIVGSTGVC